MERREYQDYRQNNFNSRNFSKKRPFSEVQNATGSNGGASGNELPSHLFSASCVAPWCSREEWMDVYRQLAPVLAKPDKDIIRSLNIEELEHIINSCWARAWDVRQDTAATTILVLKGLRAILLSEPNSELAGPMAVIRFVKIVSEPLVGGRDREQPRDTIMNVCRRFGVPSWVVQLRHDYSHNDMHELHKLEDTLKFVARWLKSKFWDEEEKRINRKEYMSQLLEGPAMLKSHVLQQRFRTDLLNIREAFRSDVKAGKNWRKAKRNQLKPHFSSLTNLLKEDSHQNLDILSTLLAEEFLSPADASLDSLGTTEEIHALRDSLPPGLPSSSRNDWYALVEHVLSFPGGPNSLLNNLAQLMGDSNSDRDYLTCAWLLCILMEILPTNCKSSVRIWDAVNFMLVAKRITAQSSPFALPVLEKMAKLRVSNDKEYKFMQDMTKLCRKAYPSLDNWCGRTVDPEFGDENPSFINTVEELKISVQPSFSDDYFPETGNTTSARWTTDTSFNWKNLPIGILPNNHGTSLDLYHSLLLPKNIIPKEAARKELIES